MNAKKICFGLYATCLLPSIVFAYTQVWVGSTGHFGITCYDFGGNVTGSISTGQNYASSISVINNEVWVGSTGHFGITRYDFGGNVIGSISTGQNYASSIVLIPEPAALLLIGLGSLVLWQKNKTLSGSNVKKLICM